MKKEKFIENLRKFYYDYFEMHIDNYIEMSRRQLNQQLFRDYIQVTHIEPFGDDYDMIENVPGWDELDNDLQKEFKYNDDLFEALTIEAVEALGWRYLGLANVVTTWDQRATTYYTHGNELCFQLDDLEELKNELIGDTMTIDEFDSEVFDNKIIDEDIQRDLLRYDEENNQWVISFRDRYSYNYIMKVLNPEKIPEFREAVKRNPSYDIFYWELEVEIIDIFEI